MNKLLAAACFAACALPCAFEQTVFAETALPQTACHGARLSGVVRDSTRALIPGATVTLDQAQTATSASDGTFVFRCVDAGPHHLSAAAPGFAKRDLPLKSPHPDALDLILQPKEVDTQVDVSGNDANPANAATAGPSQTISGSRLQSLADDPDDLLRELQQLAAAAGGNPANATIAVDGFQGSSALPPKSSIAYIQVNPDQFSAQYREPPFGGGRVEVYTKPGQPTYHGALFLTNGSPWENARDPFSTSKAALGKQRYGFELTGPIRKTGSDFSLTLEHRSIDNYAVVNAITLDPSGDSIATVAERRHAAASLARHRPRRLAARPQKHLPHQLQRQRQSSRKRRRRRHLPCRHRLRQREVRAHAPLQRRHHHLRAPHARSPHSASRWDGEDDLPVSTAPQVQVAGAFTDGGANIGPQQLHELNIEADDDAILTTKKHTLKFGTQFMVYNEHQLLTTNFNGTYTFGGGTAPVLDASNNPIPGQTETITGVEQYRRALLNLAGGTPTAFSNVAGSPTVDFTQFQDALFVQDDWNVGHNVHIAAGVRYFIQNQPTVLDSMTPRVGIVWSPTKKGTWTLHAHAGMFSGFYGEGDQAEVLREDGTARITSTVYNPVYGNPFLNATTIHSMRQFSPHLTNLTWAAENIGGTRSLPRGWNLSADYYFGRIWNYSRTENINSPLNDEPTGPRPGPANLNILQMQNSGQGRVNATFMGIEQHSLKHLQLFFGGVRVQLVDDTDDSEFSTPQSSSTDAGEFAHRTGQPTWNIFGNATLTLPKKIQLSGDFHGGGDAHYNITTGFDNNGDGDFNDRPQYATPSTPGAIATPYGLLVASGGTGVFPRNKGVMPWTYYLDTNLQRAFTLTRNAKAEHQQVVTVNVRSSNVLNHTNVTAVGGVLGSPLFGVPYAADNGRRIEAGLRYSF